MRSLSQSTLEANQKGFVDTYQAELLNIERKSQARLNLEYADSSEQYYDILVLSGGGELGAFGAGFLRGWGEVSEQGFQRPEFDSVSGISTGALIAPFAFIGTDKAYDDIVALYENPDDNLIVPKTLFSFLIGQGAYFDATVLHERIRKSISQDVVASLAKGSESNRVLLVGATNLDYGVMRVWDLADIASQHPVQMAKQLITTKLIASSAIPSAFPPVLIDNYLYVDGGASMQVVSGIENRNWVFNDEEIDEIESFDISRPIKIRIWVIVNNKLLLEPKVTQKTWASIATRSLQSLMRGSTLQTIQDAETYAHLIDEREEFEVSMRYVSIPQDYNIADTVKMFDKDKMRALVELGEQMGRDPDSWNERAIRPGASIIDQF